MHSLLFSLESVHDLRCSRWKGTPDYMTIYTDSLCKLNNIYYYALESHCLFTLSLH